MIKKAITRRTFLKGAGVALGVMGGMQLMSKGTWSDSAGIKVPFSRGTELPHLKVPPNAADCHHHIYDSSCPVDPTATLLPPDASITDYRLLQKRLGTTRNVVIQPSTYGCNNSGLVTFLKKFGLATTRGVAVVNTDVSDEELKKLNAAGVRGIRFNLVQAGSTSMEMVMPLSKRIQALGWHIQINAMPKTIVAGADVWNNVPCPVVFDHLGHVAATDNPALNVITGLMKKGKGWVKLTGVYQDSKVGAPTYADTVEIGKVYVKAAPGQVVWGSDWPHPTEKLDNKPDDAILLDLLTVCAPDVTTRNRILVSNPERLYGFPK
jgi:predicted TIM-barrel fold metal-dependent hydrolase